MSECRPELGIMLDFARGAVLTLPALKHLIRLSARMGYSFIGLYLEDLIEIEGEPYFGYQRGRLSLARIREADAYARSMGMELRPYIQTLAHLNQIRDYACYQELFDTDDILLAESAPTYQLLDRMLKAVSQAFSSRRINIGMDEAHRVGLGRYLEQHGYTERIDILLRHLNRVLALCEAYGLEAEMWSDMFFRLLEGGDYYLSDHADQADKQARADKLTLRVRSLLPKQLRLAYWDYYSLDTAHYEEMLSIHKRLTDRISFAGGAWRWMGFAPCNRYSIRATRAALKACKNAQVPSIVLTLWGDDGSECSPFALLPTLFEAAREVDRLWGPSGIAPCSFFELTGYHMEDFLLLDEVNPGCGLDDQRNNLSKVLLYNDPLLGLFDQSARAFSDSRKGEAVCGLRTYYEETAQKLEMVLEQSAPRAFDALFRSMAALCRCLSLKAELGFTLRKAYRSQKKEQLQALAQNEIPQLISRLDAFYAAFRAQWLSEAEGFGFEVQSIRIGGLIQRLKDVQLRLTEYLNGQIDSIPELEADCLPPGYVLDDPRPAYLEFNRYEKIATTARLSW